MRCWVHKTANVMDAPPKAAQPAAKKALQDIYNAEDRTHAEQAITTFAKLYGKKFPKAVAKVVDDQNALLAFYDFSAERWIHLRTTNPIESTFATVCLRTKVARGAGYRAAGPGDGVQTGRDRSGPLAHRQRRPSHRPGPRRSPVLCQNSQFDL
jgi:putative transposase